MVNAQKMPKTAVGEGGQNVLCDFEGLKKYLRLGCRKWGCNKWGFKGVWPPFSEIGRNRPFPPFFCLLRPFPEGLENTWKIQKTEEKGLFPQTSSDFLKPPSLKPPICGTPNRARPPKPISVSYVFPSPEFSTTPLCRSLNSCPKIAHNPCDGKCWTFNFSRTFSGIFGQCFYLVALSNARPLQQKWVIMKGGFSLKRFPSLKALNSLESLENGPIPFFVLLSLGTL